jgi:hypothetical protein
MTQLESTESSTTRPGFLKRLGVTLAAGVGVAGVLASRAFATPGQCCFDTTCGNCDGGEGQKYYCMCDCSGIGSNYCYVTPSACLYQHQCISCPC